MILLDTNILLRTYDFNDELYGVVSQAERRLIESGQRLVTCPQALYESYVVLTRPLEVNGFGYASLEAMRFLDKVLSSIEVIPDPPDLIHSWKSLCEKYQVQGVQAHDARIVAYMLSVGISELLTLNASHFSRFTEIKTITPESNVST